MAISPGHTIGERELTGVAGVGTEFWRSGTIVDELQTGTIQHIIDLPGFPENSYESGLMVNLHIGAPHPWMRGAYLIRRQFSPLVNRLSKDDAQTRVTLTYQRRTCPHHCEINTQVSMASIISWWYYSDPPAMITKIPTGIPLLRPQTVLTLHYPLIQTTPGALRQLELTAGSVLGNLEIGFWEDGPQQNYDPDEGPLVEESEHAHDKFFGFPYYMTLFDGVSSRVLRSSFDPEHTETMAWYDVTLTFRIDPWRHHQKWQARGIGLSFMPERVATLEGLMRGDGHNKFILFPTFDRLVDDPDADDSGDPQIQQSFLAYMRHTLNLNEEWATSCGQDQTNLLGT